MDANEPWFNISSNVTLNVKIFQSKVILDCQKWFSVFWIFIWKLTCCLQSSFTADFFDLPKLVLHGLSFVFSLPTLVGIGNCWLLPKKLFMAFLMDYFYMFSLSRWDQLEWTHCGSHNWAMSSYGTQETSLLSGGYCPMEGYAPEIHAASSFCLSPIFLKIWLMSQNENLWHWFQSIGQLHSFSSRYVIFF